MAEGGEKIVAKFYSIRHKKQDGVLFLTSGRVAWSVDDRVQANYPYPEIKAQRISAESSSKIRLQLILLNGSQVNFHFTGDDALGQRNQAKQLLQQLLSQATSLHANPELEAKTSLLNKDPGLYQLYRDLVVQGLISADEFWANRLAKQDADASIQQESGLPSAFLADVQAVTDGCNAVKYNITADVIRSIFRTYPAVKVKHSEMVPHKMKEEEFWVQFFQSQLFHRDSSSSSSRKDLFAECLVNEHSSILGKGGGGEPSLIQTSASESLGEGYSVAGEEATGPPPQQLVQRCNHHSIMVLKAISDASDTSLSTVVETGSPSNSSPSKQKLQLQESRHQKMAVASPDTLLSVAAELSSWKGQQTVDVAAVHSALGYLMPGGTLMSAGRHSGSAGSSLSAAQKESLFRHQAAVSELLRHFWACFPPLSAALEEKFHKMGRCLQEYHDSQLKDLSLVLGADESGAVGHLSSCIGIALEKYQAWQSRAKGRS